MSRKYRQRGYRDDEPRERQSGPRTARRQEGPRGRGLGRPTREVVRCRECGREVGAQQLDEQGALRMDARCAGCGADLHACFQCSHFDTSARFECRQPIPERISAKREANDCERYSPRVTFERAEDAAGGATGGAKSARDAFDALFE